ncbi:MAG TPA: nuclear transport factor 2 family protein [Pyrinomonadaceae bacterium]|nr:nuclear transport factor 2 family protein [Pyrinomonadaceae bacterium]
MLKRFFFCLALTCAVAPAALAQNANSSTTTRSRTATAAPQNANSAAAPQEEPAPTPTPRASNRRRGAGQDDPTSKDVLGAFNAITEGIKAANAGAVNGGYWNSQQLTIYNNNGTVTRGWEQMRSNRESLYAKVKDVTLDVRDVHVQMLGRDGAVVAFLWTQSQTFDGTPGTATGRTTLVFRRIGKQWKVVHAHISPDAPDQTRVPPAERTTTPTPKPTP